MFRRFSRLTLVFSIGSFLVLMYIAVRGDPQHFFCRYFLLDNRVRVRARKRDEFNLLEKLRVFAEVVYQESEVFHVFQFHPRITCGTSVVFK